jgi:hypothetical protein
VASVVSCRKQPLYLVMVTYWEVETCDWLSNAVVNETKFKVRLVRMGGINFAVITLNFKLCKGTCGRCVVKLFHILVSFTV